MLLLLVLPRRVERGQSLDSPGSAAAKAADADAAAADPDTVYDIERVLRAEKVSGKYLLWIKWAGHADPTPEWRHFIVKETTNRELLEEIADAVKRCQEELRLEEGDEDDEDDEAAEQVLAKTLGTDAVELGRGKRQREQSAKYSPSWLLHELFHCCLEEASDPLALPLNASVARSLSLPQFPA